MKEKGTLKHALSIFACALLSGREVDCVFLRSSCEDFDELEANAGVGAYDQHRLASKIGSENRRRTGPLIDDQVGK